MTIDKTILSYGLIIPVLIFSMLCGFYFVIAVKKTKIYSFFLELDSSRHFGFYKNIGVNHIKKLIIKTPLKYFNQEIIVKRKKINEQQLLDLKRKMTDAEVGHIFAFNLILLICFIFFEDYTISSILLFVLNIMFNLYPIFIQQMNKTRLNRLFKI